MDRPKLIQKLKYNARTGKVTPLPMGKGVILEEERKESMARLKGFIYPDFARTIKVVPIKAKNKLGESLVGVKVVYLFCKEEDCDEIKRLLSIYADDTRNDHKLTYPMSLGSSIVNVGGDFGWHCVDRDFLIFTNPLGMITYIHEIIGE